MLQRYGAALSELGSSAKEVGRWANTRVENPRPPFRRAARATLRLGQRRTSRKFASVHADVDDHFNHERLLVDRQACEQRRSAALAEWQALASRHAADEGGGASRRDEFASD